MVWREEAAMSPAISFGEVCRNNTGVFVSGCKALNSPNQRQAGRHLSDFDIQIGSASRDLYKGALKNPVMISNPASVRRTAE